MSATKIRRARSSESGLYRRGAQVDSGDHARIEQRVLQRILGVDQYWRVSCLISLIRAVPTSAGSGTVVAVFGPLPRNPAPSLVRRRARQHSPTLLGLLAR